MCTINFYSYVFREIISFAIFIVVNGKVINCLCSYFIPATTKYSTLAGPPTGLLGLFPICVTAKLPGPVNV